MIRSVLASALLSGLLAQGTAFAAPLITAKEAALPPAAGALATRGISRGPAIKMVSPEPEAAVKSPFNLKLNFEARGGEKIDPNSVKVVYMKSPFVDLTSRLQSAITPTGIDFQQAEVPPGEHTLRVTVKDSAGRETNSTMTIVVNK
ncbi:MAG: hypothetical protein U9R55_01465 [Pseudomonadota bacterium]|jgi:hypothetical protein|uniref:hypothetical protein n=1 Tax=Curvibacter delicatus TaxID=80879 RepID=UPI0008338847|nr:hypothetical protein [Curvibacter delicatus]MEA3393277.1 hypothetical protein [Pseudomonadota bacterium]